MTAVRTSVRKALLFADAEERTIGRSGTVALESGPHHCFIYVVKEPVAATLRDTGGLDETLASGGDVLLAPPECRFTLVSRGDREARVRIVRFDAGGVRLTTRRAIHKVKLPEAGRRFAELIAVRASDLASDDVSYLSAQSQLHAIAAAWLSAMDRPSAAEDDELEAYIKRIRRSIADDVRSPLDIDELAKRSGAGTSRFYRAFRRVTGFPPHKFVTELRLSASLRLLAGAAAVSEAAHAVGYEDELYFSRLFKKHMGLSPSEYAARANRRIANLCPVFEGDLEAIGLASSFRLPRGWHEQAAERIDDVARAAPDIIFTYPVEDNVLAGLSDIAPVVQIRWKGMPWKDRLLRIAAEFELTGVARRWLLYFEKKAENARAHVRRQFGGEPFVLAGAYPGKCRVFGLRLNKMKDLFYDELGFAAPESAKAIRFIDSDALDEAAALDCDNLLLLVPEGAPEAWIEDMQETWRGRKRAGARVLVIRHRPPLSYNAAFHESLVDRTVDLLLAAAPIAPSPVVPRPIAAPPIAYP